MVLQKIVPRYYYDWHFYGEYSTASHLLYDGNTFHIHNGDAKAKVCLWFLQFDFGFTAKRKRFSWVDSAENRHIQCGTQAQLIPHRAARKAEYALGKLLDKNVRID